MIVSVPGRVRDLIERFRQRRERRILKLRNEATLEFDLSQARARHSLSDRWGTAFFHRDRFTAIPTAHDLASSGARSAADDGTQAVLKHHLVMREFPFVPYPPIEKLGVIGDRRTAALVAPDGTVCWLCLPNYDGQIIFGALIDAAKGGGWKLGPKERRFGRQLYRSGAPILETTWDDKNCSLQLLDFMPNPQDRRAPKDVARRVVIRRLRCNRGTALCRLSLCLRVNSKGAEGILAGEGPFSFWSSFPVEVREGAIEAQFALAAGEEVWCTFGFDDRRENWTAESAANALRKTQTYWDEWTGSISTKSARRTQILRSAMLVHLLTFAPTGALIAAPTTSLPERIGGDRNYDYRYTWVRDASLGLSLLAMLGRTEDAKRFMDWLAALETSGSRPLQVLYTIEGRSDVSVREHRDVRGYQRSLPVRTGNAAADMTEIDSYGYLTDCALIYLRHGGRWEESHWRMIRRLADYTAHNWEKPGSGIWELLPQRQFLAGKVMSFVTLDRALRIASQTGQTGPFLGDWETQRARIFTDIMSRGWSERLRSFRQHYDGDTLDAAALLIPIMSLLPPEHPRITETIARLSGSLEINGFLHRFQDSGADSQTPGVLGEEEGAFLMCSFWLAQILARRGETDRAEAILAKAETIAGDLGLYAEAVDARTNAFLGNTPLVFSQVEYARAAIAIDKAKASDTGRAETSMPVGASRRHEVS